MTLLQPHCICKQILGHICYIRTYVRTVHTRYVYTDLCIHTTWITYTVHVYQIILHTYVHSVCTVNMFIVHFTIDTIYYVVYTVYDFTYLHYSGSCCQCTACTVHTVYVCSLLRCL